MATSCRWGHRPSLAVLGLLVLFIIGWTVRQETSAAEPSGSSTGKSTRSPWRSSKLTGSPDPPPPFKLVRAFPRLKFDHPGLMSRIPGSDRLVIGELAGTLSTFVPGPNAKAEPFLDFRAEIKTVQQHPGAKELESVYGLAFDPDFEKNRRCYLCYTLRAKEPGKPNLDDGTRVSRFAVTQANPPKIDASSEEILLTFKQGGHNGGDIHFGPDRMLYISAGDAGVPNPPDPFDTGQDLSDLLASILRIDVSRKDPGKNYAIPPDNPFVGTKGARPEIWAYGLRNPWRMSFDRQTGELFVGDVGWELWESVHRIEKGGNYGWSAMEGPQPVKPEKVGPTPIRPPLIVLSHTIACSITGGLVYHGQKFPELRGAYIFGDWETRRIWAARFEGDHAKEMTEIAPPSVRIAAFGEDKDGEIYVLDYDDGTINTLERNPRSARNTKFPTTLSQTGLLSSVPKYTPAAGVVSFKVNSRQWQDGASAEYLLGLPGTSSVSYYEKGKPVPGLVNWHSFRMHFPKDGVLARTLSVGGRRVETQILHYDGLDWRPYSYAWRDDQSDAELVPAEGLEKDVRDGKQIRRWQFPSRSQCMSCHSNQSEYTLAFLPEQLNRKGTDGVNQLVFLTRAGYVQRKENDDKLLPPFTATSVAGEPKLADPADRGQPLEARAKSYLHSSCGHCHSEHGGGAVALRLKFPVEVDEMKAVGVRPTRGDFSLPDACIIKPGDPGSSTLYYRMSKFGRDRMPHIGSERPDEVGLRLIEQWIASLDAAQAKKWATSPAGPTAAVLADPKSALPLARKVGRGELKPAERDSLVATAAKLSPGPVRDLFEGYLPVDPKGVRKLGSNPQPRAILAVSGDARRGETLFWSSALNCGQCHKVGDRGKTIGPDLSAIGKSRTREDLLDSLLEPSRRIEPKYAAYLALLNDGRSATGQLVKRSESGVVLRDAQDKEITLEAKDIEQLQPSLRSLMPDQQLAGLTTQEAADLLEYLRSRK